MEWTREMLQDAVAFNRSLLDTFKTFRHESTMLLEDIEETCAEDLKLVKCREGDPKRLHFRRLEFILLLKSHEQLLLKMRQQYTSFLEELYKKNMFEDLTVRAKEEDITSSDSEENAQKMPFSSDDSDA